MFLEGAQTYAVTKDPDTGTVTTRPLTDAEKQNLQPDSSDNQITIATNGIYNSLDAAAAYAMQNDPGKNTVYLVYFPEASNALAELLVAGYQKFMENNFWGLSNATAQMSSYIQQYGSGSVALTLDGYSRGAMTIGNAMESLSNANMTGVMSNTNINLYGPAYNAQSMANLLYGLGGTADGVSMQNNIADPVGTLVGNNPATGGTIPDGSSWLGQALKASTLQPNTSHNCYGNGGGASACGDLWRNSPNNQPVSVIVPAQNTVNNK
jgi:filamentous hemagglutinin